jgi:hypothetical protein
LADHDIRAILTGGACATIYSDGAYTSEDVDFVLEGSILPAELDAAIAGLGYRRDGNRYIHARSAFWIEFPRGPLAIGEDLKIEPCVLGEPGRSSLALSPTDSCRDRLAAFYHWNDLQSLAVAIEIAARHDLDVALIRRWSAAEGHLERCKEFLRRAGRSRSIRLEVE